MTGRANAKQKPVGAKELDEWWSLLRGDAAKADSAIWALALSPAQSLPFLKQQLQAAAPVDEKLSAKLLAELDSKTFSVRQKAKLDLIALGQSAETAMRKTLTNGVSLETRRRIEQILDKRGPDVLRVLRAIDALEQMGTPEARGVLRTLAGVSVNPRIVQAATIAGERLAKR